MLVRDQTEWTNSIVPVGKANDNMRLCFDPKDLNKNIERNQYYTKAIDHLSGRTPWLQALHSDGCLVRLLDGPVQQKDLIVHNIQCTMGI